VTSFADQLADDFIRHGINLQRLEAGTRRKVLEIINRLAQDLTAELRRIDPTGVERTIYAQQRAQKYLSIAQQRVTNAYKDIERIIGSDMKDMVKLEGDYTASLINGKLQVGLITGVLSAETVNAIVTSTLLFNGERLHDWMLAEKNNLLRALRGVVNQGITQGTPIPDMVKQVMGTKAAGYSDGIMKLGRARAVTIVRTAANGILNEARDQVYANNSEVIKGKQWFSTLDTRTSQICMALDGASWDLEGNPIKGTTTPWRGPPPAHPNCRSTIVPIVKSWAELTSNPKIKKKLQHVEDRIKPSTRAAMNGTEISANMTYEGWLTRQSKTIQLDVLGPTKYELWKKGQLSLSDLIDQSHRPLTVAQLRDRYGLAT